MDIVEAITNALASKGGRRAIVRKKNVRPRLPKTVTISKVYNVQDMENVKVPDYVHVTPSGLDPRIAPFPRKTRTRCPVL